METSPIPDPQKPRQELVNLTQIVADAFAFSPPFYPSAIFGEPWTWLPPHPGTSEFSVVNGRQLMPSLQYLTDISVPAVPIELPEYLPGFGDAVLWRPTTIHFQPGQDDNPYSFPREAWIFINGIATNEAMAHINARYLVSLFHRPLTIIQNATDSLGVDLLECIIGKAWSVNTEPAAKTYPFIHRALESADKKRVVVICHSQGTIIMSNVLRALLDDDFRAEVTKSGQRAGLLPEHSNLRPLEDLDLLKKLEIYAIANCATSMRHVSGLLTDRGAPTPWIESFANEYDLVARTGVIAPNREEHGIEIDGPCYFRAGKWGHLLNVHYLYGFDEAMKGARNPYVLKDGHDSDGHSSARPRLFDYFAGQSPEPL